MVAADVNVSVLLPLPGDAIDAGANFAVTPFGNPATESDTADLYPFTATVVSTKLAAFPAFTAALEEPAVSVNVGTITVRLTACVCVTAPPRAFTVIVDTPPAAVVAAVNFKVLVPLPGDAMLAGENAAVTPFGNPVADSVTADLNPAITVVVTEIETLLPAVTVALPPLAAKVKDGLATVTPIDELRVSPPPLAMIVTE